MNAKCETCRFFDEHTRGWSRGENDSLICAILDAEVDGRPIAREEALAYLWVLFVGALDTVAHTTSIGLLSLFHHPEQFDRLRSELEANYQPNRNLSTHPHYSLGPCIRCATDREE